MEEQHTPMPERVGLYDVEARLGEGGMGEVYRGWDPRLERPVALKRVKADAHDPDWSRQLLRREARSVARLRHTAIVQIYELVEGAEEDWLVLELVDGISLRQAYGERPLGSFQTVQIARGIVEGLIAAHAAGIVHRDLKVDNVMVSSDGRIKILDFGICKHMPREDVDEGTQTLSAGGRILGTASVMSPEQVMGSSVDHRSDLFSLGCLLYELLTGQSPFVAENFRDTMSRICLHKEIPVGELNPSVPPALSQLVADLLEKDPGHRPQSAKKVLRVLDQLSSELMEARTTDFSPEDVAVTFNVEEASGLAEATSEETGPSVPTLPASSTTVGQVRDKAPWFVAGALVALLGGALVFGLGIWSPFPRSGLHPEEVRLETLETHQLYEHAQELMLRYDKPGHLDQAVEALQLMLGREPDSAAAYAGLAKAYLMSYSYTSRDSMWLQLAAPAAEQGVELDPFLAAAHVSLGTARFEAGDASSALGSLREAQQLDPDNPDVYHGYGRIFETEGDFESAESSYRKALELQPTRLEFLLRMGVFLNRNARADEAEAFFLESIEVAPDGVLGYRNLAGMYYQQGELGRAAGMLQKSLEIKPHPTVYSNLGTLYFSQGLYQKSALAFEKAVAMPDGANRYIVWANLGDAYRWIPQNEPQSHGAYLRAIQLLKPQVESKPDDITLRSRLALYRAKRGEKEAALSMIDLPLQELDPSALYRVAVVHELCGQRDRALEALAAALQKGYSLNDVKSDPELLDLREDLAYHQLATGFESL